MTETNLEEKKLEEENQDNGRKNGAKSGCYSSGQSGNAKSYKSSRINCHRAGGHGRNRDKIGKFLHTEPAVTVYNFTLDERNGCIASSYTEKSYFQKAEKKLYIDHLDTSL